MSAGSLCPFFSPQTAGSSREHPMRSGQIRQLRYPIRPPGTDSTYYGFTNTYYRNAFDFLSKRMEVDNFTT